MLMTPFESEAPIGLFLQLLPAQQWVYSWHCWDHEAPLQNRVSLWDQGRDTDPPGTAAELDEQKFV